jgi:endonuclease/exonuclease/phosphatase family metal-dependent hydrolase
MSRLLSHSSHDSAGDSRYPPRRLWDSDLPLHTLGRVSIVDPLPAAGDFNGARDFDINASGGCLATWGQEYFDTATDLGFVPWLSKQWDGEKATHGSLQLDHVLVSNRLVGVLSNPPAPLLDDRWVDRAQQELGDHVPVWFAINDDWLA